MSNASDRKLRPGDGKAPETMVMVIAIAMFVLFLTGGGWLAFKIRAHAQERRALAELKERNPVEYHVLHTSKIQSDDELKQDMVGNWELAGVRVRTTGQFLFIPPHNGYFKTWTLTNWAITTYDAQSNLLYNASGHYTVQGDVYTESIEAATGSMTRFLHAHPAFRVRVDGDTFYQMSARKTESPLEEMWRRVE